MFLISICCVSGCAIAADCTSPITKFKAGSIGVQQTLVLASDPTGAGNLTNSCDPYDEGIYATQVEASYGDDGMSFPIPASQIEGAVYGSYSVYVSPFQETIYYTPSSNPGFAYSNVIAIWTYDNNLNIVAETLTVNVSVASVPGAPTIGTATAGNSQASVYFTAPLSNNGSTITDYTVTSSPGNITADGSNSPVTVGGLSNGTTYTFTVTATSGNGTGPSSGPSNAVTPLSVPGVPSGVLATAGNGQAVVSFTPPALDGGAAITSYRATSSPSGLSAVGSSSPLTVTGLTDGRAYSFTVTASNSQGSSAPSSPSNSVTPAAAPIAEPVSVTIAYDSGVQPVQLTISGGTSTSVKVASPPSHGSASASGTGITYSPVTGYFGSDAFTYIAANAAGTSPAATVSISVSGPTITVLPATLVSGVEGSVYNQSLVPVGGQAPYIFSPQVASGALPAGLSISSAGAITGIPSVTCTCTFTVSGRDSSTATPESFVSSPISLAVVAMASTVNGIAPSYGADSGGATITITGANFTPGSTVHFGSRVATQVTYLDSGSLIAVAPAGTGTVDVTVTTAGGTSSVSPADQFTYIPQTSGLRSPSGVAVDGAGNLYIADAGLTYLIKMPTGCSTPSCKTILGVGFTAPTGVAIDGNGNVYVLSGGSEGIVTKLAWDAANLAYEQQCVIASGLDISATAPGGIAVDSTGNVYIADTNNQRVLRLPWNANAAVYEDLITIASGSGLSNPNGVAISPQGDIYIADHGTQTLTRVSAAGTQTILASSLSAEGIAVDGSGDVYYSDPTDDTITKLPWNGSYFGSPVVIATNLGTPYGIAVTDSGDLYTVSNKNTTIIKVSVTSPPAFTFASTKLNATSVDSPMILTLGNIGNAPLAFAPPTATNPQISPGFMLSAETSCPEVYQGAAPQTLAPGDSCQYAISFVPTTLSIYAGALVVSDDNLNDAAAMQSIALTGLGAADDNSVTTLTVAPGSVVPFGSSITITATVTDTTNPSVTPTGIVTLGLTGSLSSTTISSWAIPLTNSSATLSSYTPANAGIYTISSNYSGAVGSLSASVATASVTVTKYTPTLIYTPALTTQVFGSPISAGVLNATAIDAAGEAIAGTFAYSTLLGSINTLIAAGSTLLPAATYTLTATFIPTDTTNYVSGHSVAASSPYIVTPLGAIIQLGDLSQVYSTAEHRPSVSTTPSNLATSLTYNGSTTTPIEPGSYTVVAVVTDPNYTGSATGTLLISKGSTSVLLSSGTNPVLAKATLMLTAAVSAPAGFPTGVVAFRDGETILGTSTLINGTAILPVNSLSVGSHSLTAVYLGNAEFLAVSSSSLAQTVVDSVITISSPMGEVPTATAQAGGTASYQLGISPTGTDKFSAAVTFTVVGLPPGASFKLTPAIIPAGAGPTNVTLAVTLPQTSSSLSHALRSVAPFTFALALLPFGKLVRKTSKRLRQRGSFLLAFAFLITWITGMTGCAGSSSVAQQSYLLTLTATSEGVAYTSTVTLIVH